MKNVVIAPVGDHMESLFYGLREVPTERVILISPKDRFEESQKAKKDLERFKIPVQIIEIEGPMWEEMFKAVSDLRELEKESNLIINVATGDRESRCAATSAAFVNGIKAFAAEEKGSQVLPVMKFSYYHMLTEKKMQILKILYENDCCSSLEELSKRAKMSLPLISYHINGNLKSEGLKQLGLVETKEKNRRVEIVLSTLGKLLIKGYVKPE